MAKKRPTAKNKVADSTSRVHPALDDFDFWKQLSRRMVGGKDGWQINEVALLMQETAKLLSGHWDAASTLCNRTESKQINIGLTLSLDRRNTPSEASVKLGYREAHSDFLTAKTPDPEQDELPLFSDKKSKAEADGDTPAEYTEAKEE